MPTSVPGTLLGVLQPASFIAVLTRNPWGKVYYCLYLRHKSLHARERKQLSPGDIAGKR